MKNKLKSVSGKKSTARDVFFYLLMIVTLYVGIVSFLTVMFQFINIVFPDPLDYYNSYSSALRGGISALMVVWPVYLLISWFIEKDIRQDGQKKNIWVRRWLLYLTLFISAITIIIDLITLINGFLDGELTARFSLKVVAVLLVAGSAFWYYLWALNNEAESKRPKVFGIVTSVVAVAAIIAALVAVGSPSKQRDLRFDDQRISNLEAIQYQVTEHWRNKEVLPSSLSDISLGVVPYEAPTDPETQEPFQYNVLSELSFELCANFAYPSDEKQRSVRKSVFMGRAANWDYDAGQFCFERTIDPDYFTDNNQNFPGERIPARDFVEPIPVQ